MSHYEVFVAFGAVHGVGSGGTFLVASFGITAGLTGVVIVDAVAVGPTVVLVEVFANGWSAVVVTVVVAVVAPIAIAVDVVTAIVGSTGLEFEAKGCDVG
jgi:hypothetical protein